MVDEKKPRHKWGYDDRFKMVICSTCMIVRRKDKKNKPCKGRGVIRKPLNPFYTEGSKA